MFSVHLVTADSYMSKPLPVLDVGYSEFRGSEVNQVPVIRVFGSTPTGEKACLHVHGVFPYLYVPCVAEDPPERQVYRLASALDKALNISLGCSTASTQHVYCVALVSAIPFYGYHSTEQQFLKVSLYNPAMVKRAAELLQNGAVLGRSLQPHEAHLPFLLQFMVDYNLYGMAPVLLEHAHFRRPVHSNVSGVMGEELLLPESVQRVSSCAIEVDTLASAILNPRTLNGEVDGNPGLAGIWEEERERRRMEGRGSQPTPHSSQPRHAHLKSIVELHQHQLLQKRLATLKLQEAGNQPQDTLAVPRDDGYLEHFESGHEGTIDKDLACSSSASQLDDDDAQVLQDLLHLRACSNAVDTESEEEDDEDDDDLSESLLPSHRSSYSSEKDASRYYKNEIVWEDSYWDQFSGRIPQLDGAEDDEDISTYSPVICSGKFGRQCTGNRGRESRQLTGENVIDGTRWPEYRGLLDGLCDLDVNPQRIASPGGSILGDCMEFPYELGMDLDGLELGPFCAASTSGAYESLPLDTPTGADLTNYNLEDMSEDYSSALINDVFLSAITDDATQCTDIQSLAGADFTSDVGFQTLQSESVFDSEDVMVEELLRRAPIPSKTVPGLLPTSKDAMDRLRSCEDGSLFLGTYPSSECVADAVKGFPSKQFETGAPVSNFVMMAHSDGSVNILNAAMASTAQFPKMCRDNTYVRLVPFTDYRNRVALGSEAEGIKTSCVDRVEAGRLSSGMFGAESFTNGRRVISVDRTTETSPSLLRCSDAGVSGRDADNFLAGETLSSHRDKSKKVVKFFLKSSLLRETPPESTCNETGTDHNSRTQKPKDSTRRSDVYHSALMTKSQVERSPKLFRYNERSPPRKVNNFCEPFTSKSRTLCEKLGHSGREMERHAKYGMFSSSSRFCDRFTRDVTKPRRAAYHISNAEYFLSRKEPAYHKTVGVERLEGRRAVDMQSSPTTSEEDKSILVKVESSPVRSRNSPEVHRQCGCCGPEASRQHGLECRSSIKGDYDPYEFSDEMEELLSCGSPPNWPRRCLQGPGKPTRPGPMRGGKPASYLRQGATHRVRFHMTRKSSTSPVGPGCDESESPDETAGLAQCSKYSRTVLRYTSSPHSDVSPIAQNESTSTLYMDSVVENIKPEPVWEEELTSIPKLTLLRTGDNYINFVRLDDEGEDSCSPMKQEQLSEEDKPIEVAAVKDENEADTCESLCSLEQLVEDDKSIVTTNSDMYSPEKRNFEHFSDNDCAELKGVVCGVKNVELGAANLDSEVSPASVVIVPAACEFSMSEPDYKDVGSFTDHVQVADDAIVELVNLSPSIDDTSFEFLDVSFSSGNLQKCGGKVCRSEAMSVDTLPVISNKPATVMDSMHSSLDVEVSTVTSLPLPSSVSTVPCAQPHVSRDETNIPVYKNESCKNYTAKEIPFQPIGNSSPLIECREADDMNSQGLLSLETNSGGQPEVAPSSSTANSQQKQRKLLKVDHNNDTSQVRKVTRASNVSLLKALGEKKPRFLVKKGTRKVLLKKRNMEKQHILEPNRKCENESKKLSIDNGCVDEAIAKALQRLRGRPRGAKCTYNIGRVEVGAQELCKNTVEGEVALLVPNLQTTVCGPSQTAGNQVNTSAKGSHSRVKLVSKNIRKCKKKLPHIAADLISSRKQQLHKNVNDSNIYGSNTCKISEGLSNIIGSIDSGNLKCSKLDNSEWSSSLPDTPTKSLHTKTNTEVCNSDELGSVGVVTGHGSPLKPVLSSRQKADKLEKSLNVNRSESCTAPCTPKKISPKTGRMLISTIQYDQVETVTSDSLQSAPGVEPDEVNRAILSVDGAELYLIPRTPTKHGSRTTNRVEARERGRQLLPTLSPTKTPQKGRKKMVNILNLEHTKCVQPYVMETKLKLHHAAASHDHGFDLGSCKILSVCLSKSLPKCQSDSKVTERCFSTSKDAYHSDHNKVSHVDFVPKITRKANVSSKRVCSHTSQESTTHNSKPYVLHSVPYQENCKKLNAHKNRCTNKEGSLRMNRKVNYHTMEMKKQRKVNKEVKLVGRGPEVQKVNYDSKLKVKRKRIKKSSAVGVSNKQDEVKRSKNTTQLYPAISTEKLINACKRQLTDNLSQSGTERKLRKRFDGETLCQNEGRNSHSTMELKVGNKQPRRKVDASGDRRSAVKTVNTRAAVRTMSGAQHNCSHYDGRNNLPQAHAVESSFPLSTNICENLENLTAVREFPQKPAHQDSIEKQNDKTYSSRASKMNNRFLQSGKVKSPKLNSTNINLKDTVEMPWSRTLRSYKKICSHGVTCKNVERNSCAKLPVRQTCKAAGAFGSDSSSYSPPIVAKSSVGRARKKSPKGDCISNRTEVKESMVSSNGKAKSSKMSKRNSGYVKQLRSYTSKQGDEVSRPCKGRSRRLRNITAPATKIHTNTRIPCLDGASGTSSSEEEALIDCSQSSSPEPPLKKMKEGFVGVMVNRSGMGYRSNVEDKKAGSRRRLRGCKVTRTVEKGRLGVEIVKSPRRQHVACEVDMELANSTPDLGPYLPTASIGQCLAAVEATTSIRDCSDNIAVQDAEIVMGVGETAKRLLVPSKTTSEEKPKIVQFRNNDFLYPSACDNVQEGPHVTVGAMNHRSVRKKLKFSVSHHQQQQTPGGKQPIKILRRSSLDMFADSSSLLDDACKCGTSVAGVFRTSDIQLESRNEVDCKCDIRISESDKSARDDRSLYKREDSENEEGIISFYEAALLSPSESGCSYDSLGSLGTLPPSPQVQSPMEPRYRHQEPFYSDPRDVTGPMQVGNMVLHLHSGPAWPRDSVVERVVSPELDVSCERRRILVPTSPGHEGSDEEFLLSPDSPGPAHSTPLGMPQERGKKDDESLISPLHSSQASELCKQVLRSQLRQALADSPCPVSCCQVAGTTPDNTHAYLLSFHNLHEARPVVQHTLLTLLSLELHVSTRGDLRPDPQLDPIQAVFYAVLQDVPDRPHYHTGALVVGSLLQGAGIHYQVECVADELALLAAIQQLVTTLDPDILAGYEVEMLSWGYLFQRSFVLGVNLCPRVSRIPDSSKDSHVADSGEGKDRHETRVAGRILLDVWRIMRRQVTLQSYMYENVVYHVLHQRRPLHSPRCLTSWWDHPTPFYRWIVVEHYMERVAGTVRLLEQLDVLATTSELARLFGIQFYEVLTRGSQFRVESMMLRLAKLHNYVAVSPSVKQRAGMRAPEFLQLIMEPESRFYSDPVIVLDFQSLYPSIIIAYNYCFSTCLGRASHLGQPGSFPFGCSELKVPPDVLECLLRDITISPCGVAFVGASTRLGILPRMLQEILHTRLMVKAAMKKHPSDKILQRVLHARQLGLKLIANVTYGYTAANFSGRMPCVEVADSVVSKGRETLERAIQLVESTKRWDARVVYGDTDSMFVLVAGRSRAQAFAIGAEIAQAVTLDNPVPVKLKLEKVYQPCILQTKKRYVGYAFEDPSQEKPTYDAKGIETVRRDGCPAVGKVLEKALRVLFDTRDVSLVKRYVCRQWDKLVQGRANVHDLVFAREYRGRAGYRPGASVPALQLARQWFQTDPRAEPRVGERVPYVIVSGPPTVPLIRLVRSPHDLLADPSLRVNAPYYITRVIMPALRRCFSLLGADVDAWYAGMPRRVVSYLPLTSLCLAKRSTISQYFATVNCATCDQPTHGGLCPTCLQLPHKVMAVLVDKVRSWERTHSNITKVCRSCCGRYEPLDCSSLDCPILFRRNQAHHDLLQEVFARELLVCNFPSCDW